MSFASDEQKIGAFLTEQYPGFDLSQVLTALDLVAATHEFTWDSIRVELTALGNLHIQHQYDALNFDKKPLSLRRILRRPTANGRRVSHEEMVLPKSMQRQGFSRKLIRPYYEQYKAAKVDCIDVHAALNGGGYAWAKYGFDAVNPVEVLAILARARSLNIDKEFLDILAEDATAFYAMHPPDTPFRINDWARTPFAKELLVGTNWHGVLNLHNSEQVATFEEYLYSEL